MILVSKMLAANSSRILWQINCILSIKSSDI